MSKLKTWSLVALTSILATSIVGCGRPAATGGSQSSSQDKAAPAKGDAKATDSSGSGAKMVLKFSHVVGEDTPKHQAALKFAELVKEKSKGRIEVQVFPNSTLYGDKDEIQALQNNQVNFIAPATSKLTNIPEWQVFDLPYMFRDDAHYKKVMEGPVGEKLFKLLEPQNMTGLAMWAAGYRNVSNTKHEIVKPEDMKGLKIRVQPGKVYEEMFKAAGAIPTAMAFGEVYQALQSGTVDAQENAYSNIYSSKFYEVTPYMTDDQHALLSYVVLTNDKWFKSLSAEDQKIIKDAMNEATAYGLEQNNKLNEDGLKKILDSGKVKLTKLTPEQRQAWADFYKPVREKLAKDLKIEDLVKEIENTK